MRYLYRRLFKAPLFSLMVIFTMLLSVGIPVGLFSITRQLLSKETGIPEILTLVHYTIGDHTTPVPLSGPACEALQATPGIGDLALWKGPIKLLLQGPDGEIPIRGALVNGKFFAVMKIKPAIGRFFGDNDDQAGGGPSGWAAVISHGFWVSQYHSDPQVVGKIIAIQGLPVRILGVLPSGFVGATPPTTVAVLLPRHFLDVLNPKEDRFAHPGFLEWQVFGRLQEGERIERVRSLLHLAEGRIRREADPTGQMLTGENFPGLSNGPLLSATPGDVTPSYSVRTASEPLSIMDGLAVALALLGVSNIILLFVGRNARQLHEIAVRQTLGARQMNILKLKLEEAAFLSLAGIVASIPFSWAIAHVVSVFVQSFEGLDSFPFVLPKISVFLQVASTFFVVTLASAAATTVWSGPPHSPLASRLTGRGVTGRRHAAIVGIEIFAALVLSSCTCIAAMAIQNMVHRESGFGDSGSVVARLALSADSSEKQERIMRQIFSMIAQYPGIEAIAAIDPVPLSGDIARGDFTVRGRDMALVSQQDVWPERVTLHYLQASGAKLMLGRDFMSSDLNGPPVCLVSMNLAKKFFGQDDPLDKVILSGSDSMDAQTLKPYCRVIGVVEDAHFTSMSRPPDKVIYRLDSKTPTNLVIRGYSSSIASRAVRSVIEPNKSVAFASEVMSLREHIRQDLRLLRALTQYTAICSAIAAIIMSIGLFGVLAIEVAGRKKEIGIRLALGAGRSGICAAIFMHYRRAILLGILLGSLTSFVIMTQLFQPYVTSWTYMVIGYCAGLLLVLVMILCGAGIPIIRALRVPLRECLQEP